MRPTDGTGGTLSVMNALLPLTLLLIAPALGLDDCEACKKGKVCKPHVKFEQAEIKRLRAHLASEVVEERIEALGEIAGLKNEHENVPSADVARILADALEDVRERNADQLFVYEVLGAIGRARVAVE